MLIDALYNALIRAPTATAMVTHESTSYSRGENSAGVQGPASAIAVSGEVRIVITGHSASHTASVSQSNGRDQSVSTVWTWQWHGWVRSKSDEPMRSLRVQPPSGRLRRLVPISSSTMRPRSRRPAPRERWEWNPGDEGSRVKGLGDECHVTLSSPKRKNGDGRMRDASDMR